MCCKARDMPRIKLPSRDSERAKLQFSPTLSVMMQDIRRPNELPKTLTNQGPKKRLTF